MVADAAAEQPMRTVASLRKARSPLASTGQERRCGTAAFRTVMPTGEKHSEAASAPRSRSRRARPRYIVRRSCRMRRSDASAGGMRASERDQARGQRAPRGGRHSSGRRQSSEHEASVLTPSLPTRRESALRPCFITPKLRRAVVERRCGTNASLFTASPASQRMTAAAGFVTVAALARNPHRADVRAATTRWLSTLAASEWLRHSTEGYCATTEAAGPDFSAQDCRTGHNGGSVLPPEVVERGWLAATTECISRCAGCERCRFISVSLKERDCRPADLRSYFATMSHPVSRSPAARAACSLVRSLLQPSSCLRLSTFCSPPLARLLPWCQLVPRVRPRAATA